MELKSFVDFAYSLVNMEEVKDSLFVVPNEMVFNLSEDSHVKIHKEIMAEKNNTSNQNLTEEFDVDIFGITFRFKTKD